MKSSNTRHDHHRDTAAAAEHMHGRRIRHAVHSQQQQPRYSSDAHRDEARQQQMSGGHGC